MPAQDRARELLVEILSRAEFAEAGESLLHRLFAAINAILPGLISGPGLVAVLILSFAAVAVFLFLLIRILRRFRLSLEGEGREIALNAGPGSPRAALADSRKAAEKGSYKEALRLLLLALLLQLDEEGSLDYHYSRTNGEYLRQLRERSYPACSPAAELFSLYEKIWYGRAGCRREDYDRGLKLYGALREAGR